jgi:outer membrane protein assembly factor BamB
LDRLYLADNVADALIASGSAAEMPVGEALRVVRPQGRVWLGATMQVKSPAEGVDDWSHPYHGPDNNPQSRDQVARAPYLTQFLSDPRYAPLPQVAVAANGRVFKAFGHIAFKPREEPWLNTLAAFNGYNGTLLWKRAIPEALMVHRNTLIATADKLYFGDDQSCKVLDAATGELLDEIAPPTGLCDGTFWKWMALEDGVLYALVGEQEQRDPTIRLNRLSHGWPWNPLSPGYNQPEHVWGFGRTLLAIDPGSHKVLWHYREEQPVDSRALCMSHGRIFAFRADSYLTCLDAANGRVLWRKTPGNDPQWFETMGSALNRQDWRTNWRTTAYLKASEKALYFAGPQVGKLLAVSTEDGRVLWEHPYSNYQIVLREDGLYAVAGQMGKEVGLGGRSDPALGQQTEPSRVFDPLTGEILAEVDLGPPRVYAADRRDRRGLLPGQRRLDPLGRRYEILRARLAHARPMPRRSDRGQRAAVLVAVDVRLQSDAVRDHLPGTGRRFRFRGDCGRIESARNPCRRHRNKRRGTGCRTGRNARRLADVPRGRDRQRDHRRRRADGRAAAVAGGFAPDRPAHAAGGRRRPGVRRRLRRHRPGVGPCGRFVALAGVDGRGHQDAAQH